MPTRKIARNIVVYVHHVGYRMRIYKQDSHICVVFFHRCVFFVWRKCIFFGNLYGHSKVHQPKGVVEYSGKSPWKIFKYFNGITSMCSWTLCKYVLENIIFPRTFIIINGIYFRMFMCNTHCVCMCMYVCVCWCSCIDNALHCICPKTFTVLSHSLALSCLHTKHNTIYLYVCLLLHTIMPNSSSSSIEQQRNQRCHYSLSIYLWQRWSANLWIS